MRPAFPSNSRILWQQGRVRARILRLWTAPLWSGCARWVIRSRRDNAAYQADKGYPEYSVYPVQSAKTPSTHAPVLILRFHQISRNSFMSHFAGFRRQAQRSVFLVFFQLGRPRNNADGDHCVPWKSATWHPSLNQQRTKMGFWKAECIDRLRSKTHN